MTGRCACSCVIVMAVLHVRMFAAETLWTEVTVRVYDNTGATEAERRPSLKMAASIVSARTGVVAEHSINAAAAAPINCHARFLFDMPSNPKAGCMPTSRRNRVIDSNESPLPIATYAAARRDGTPSVLLGRKVPRCGTLRPHFCTALIFWPD